MLAIRSYMNVYTTDDITVTVDALAHYIVPEEEERRIAHPRAHLELNITDDRALMCPALPPSIGDKQGMGEVAYGQIHGVYFSLVH